jgi:hypothetical protein
VRVAQRDVDEAHRLLHASARIAMSGWPASTICAFSTRTASTTPCTPALTEFMSFITSMMHTIVSGATRVPASTNGGAPGCGER